jgi:broad specificity phosphatase PhoE
VLILVRHAMPAVSADLAPQRWPLTEEGRVAAGALAVTLPAGARLASSTETKAWQTLAAAGSDIRRDSRFDEVGRPGELFDDDVRLRRRRYVEGAEHPGWEPHADAAGRFEAGVTELLSEAAGRPVVVATHGMVLTVWLVRRGAVDTGAAGEFWSALRFPDCLVLGAAGSVPVVSRYSGGR